MFMSLYKTHTQKSTKLKINACLNGESSENLRREESRSPLALPEWRFHLTRCCCCCYRRVTRNEAIPRIRTQSFPSFICKSTHRQNKRLLMSGLTNIWSIFLIFWPILFYRYCFIQRLRVSEYWKTAHVRLFSVCIAGKLSYDTLIWFYTLTLFIIFWDKKMWPNVVLEGTTCSLKLKKLSLNSLGLFERHNY